MSEFQNTVTNSSLDTTVTSKIINRTITELKDNLCTKLGNRAFYKCLDLKTVLFQNVTSLGSYVFYMSGIEEMEFPLLNKCNDNFKNLSSLKIVNAPSLTDAYFSGCSALKKAVLNYNLTKQGVFENCTNLKVVDLGDRCSYIGLTSTGYSSLTFKGCSSLESLILRRTDGVCGVNENVEFVRIPYIYVPLALYDSYKTHSYWSQYADYIRAIEDYPEVCNIYSWEAVTKNIDNGTYKDVYKIGDTLPLDLGSEGVVNMQIVAFDTNDLADGSGKAAISWIATSPLKTKHRMNPVYVKNDDNTYQEGTGTIGGWEKCEMRTYLQNTIKPLIPEIVRNRLKNIKISGISFCDISGKKNTKSMSDDLWIPVESDTKFVYPYWLCSVSNYIQWNSIEPIGTPSKPQQSSSAAENNKGVILKFAT